MTLTRMKKFSCDQVVYSGKYLSTHAIMGFDLDYAAAAPFREDNDMTETPKIDGREISWWEPDPKGLHPHYPYGSIVDTPNQVTKIGLMNSFPLEQQQVYNTGLVSQVQEWAPERVVKKLFPHPKRSKNGPTGYGPKKSNK